MIKTDALVALIRSLTKSEKRYVKLFADLQEGDKAYWQLYQIIQRTPGGVAEMKTAFASAHPTVHFEPARKHLYRMIMKALRSYHARQTTHYRLLNLMADIDILFDKGMAESGFTLIEKAKKMAVGSEKFLHYLLLARMELQHLTEYAFVGRSEAELVVRQEKINELLSHELLINRHASLYEILLHRYLHWGVTRSTRENARLNDLLLEEHRINATAYHHSSQSDKLHLHFQSVYFLMTGQFEESLKLCSELLQLFLRHPAPGEEEPVYYIYLINEILTGLKSTGKYAAMHTFLTELERLGEKLTGRQASIAQLVAGHRLSILIDQGAFAEGLPLIMQFRAESASVESAGVSWFHFYAAVVYLGLAQYSVALQYVNQSLNIAGRYGSKELYRLNRLLNLIIHYELGNIDYLGYEIRSVERKLTTQQQLFKTEKILLNFFKRYLKAPWQRNPATELHRQLSILVTDPYERPLLRSYDFVSWAAAQARNVPFAQVMQEKAQKSPAATTLF